jgi:hypothetical protein
LFPTLTSEEAAEAETRLMEYLKLVTQISSRLDQVERGASAKEIGTLSCTPADSGASNISQPK